jgi:hypothetical protein
MNTALNGSQGDTKVGGKNYPASVDLTGKENYLWKVVNNGGIPNFALPTAVADRADFVGMSGDIIGANSVGECINPNDEARVLADSTTAINPGDPLALSPNTFGALIKPIAGYGAGFYTHEAQEAVAAGAVGQILKVRRIADRSFNI